ncbi:Hsp20/alpha crystallin family protein [Candidatus Micrarchaeota archaeon]|nr:MAG: Hsp20/alpha crystallin family protein [Candidatus Micrarchaeota archaeon]
MFPKKKRGFGFFDIDDEFERIHEMMEKMLEDAMKNMESGRSVQAGVPRVYGFSMKVGPDGKPVFEEFGNVKRATGGSVGDEREPLVDVINRKNEITVIAEVPGVEKEDIRLEVKGKSLHIRVESGKRRYDKLVRLPAEVKSKESVANYKNGVLEVKLKKVKPSKGEEGSNIKIK